MKRLMYVVAILLVLQSCTYAGRYEMKNMIPESVDVTVYIEDGEFSPDSCEGRLDRLIKTKPLILDQSYEDELQVKLNKWRNNYNSWLRKNKRDSISFNVLDIFKKTSYQYSYIQISEPVDVYRTNTDVEIHGMRNFKFFICLDKRGKIISDYKEDGWIINSCDSINSIIPNIYGQK